MAPGGRRGPGGVLARVCDALSGSDREAWLRARSVLDAVGTPHLTHAAASRQAASSSQRTLWMTLVLQLWLAQLLRSWLEAWRPRRVLAWFYSVFREV